MFQLNERLVRKVKKHKAASEDLSDRVLALSNQLAATMLGKQEGEGQSASKADLVEKVDSLDGQMQRMISSISELSNQVSQFNTHLSSLSAGALRSQTAPPDKVCVVIDHK